MNTPNPFAHTPPALDPFSLMAAWWQMWGEAQMNWLSLWQKGMAGTSAWPPLPTGGLPFSPAALTSLTAGLLPRLDAHITPLETQGSLAGASEAARLSLRMSLPSGCLEPAEMLMVEAIVARAPADTQLLPGSADKLLPGDQG